MLIYYYVYIEVIRMSMQNANYKNGCKCKKCPIPDCFEQHWFCGCLKALHENQVVKVIWYDELYGRKAQLQYCCEECAITSADDAHELEFNVKVGRLI